ncbi:MAG: leucine-rich repeat domain-containing protein [Ruminococcaceae bacterium]|nr:leucine-rich repeat domain-containing protein [Oscillospiraceae bacterium]
MNKRQKRNLEVLSNIDETIVEWSSKKRSTLKNSQRERMPKKKWYIIGGSIAAAFLLVLGSVLLLVNLLVKQVPVYTGMTVSNNLPTIIAQSVDFPLYFNAPGHPNPLEGDYHKDHPIDQNKPFPDEKRPIQDAVSHSLQVQGSNVALYYANPGESVYITVHIDNPDNFEILSFTLNGKTYSSYMFKEGSDMENLILEIAIDDQQTGILSYTIDAIKYVDGTAIKDVRMDGDKTVQVAVYTENQPAATVASEVVGYNSISMNIHVADPETLLSMSTGALQAVLYDGDAIVAIKELSLGDNSVTFDGLKTNTLYQYAVIASYDALDGEGVMYHVLAQKALRTKYIVLFDDVELTIDSVRFSLLWDEAFANKTLTSLAFYQGDTKIEDLSVEDTFIEGLSINTAYRLVGTYQNGDKTETIAIDILTGVQTLTLYADTAASTITILVGDSLPTPSRGDKVFDGWYTVDGQKVETMPATDITVYAAWQGAAIAPDLIYTTGNQGLIITGLKKTDCTELIIPAQIGGVPVVTIEREAFKGQETLTDVLLPNTLKTVGRGAFQNCTSLSTLTIPFAGASADGNGSTHFGYIFGAESVEENNLSLPSTLKMVTLNGTTPVADNAFRGCAELETVTIGAGVPTVGVYAFYDCAKLSSVSLPSGITTVGEGTFRNCTALQSITLPDGLETLGPGAFQNTGLTAIEIPASVTSVLGAYSFYGCKSLVSVTFKGDGIRGFNGYNFSECEKLESIVLPANLNSIANSTFCNCTSLESVTIPASVTQIGQKAFEGCTALTRVNYSGTLSQWMVINFSNAASNPISPAGAALCIENVNVTTGTLIIPADVTSIGAYAFCGCTGITGLTISENVTTIGTAAFEGCTALTSIAFNATTMNALAEDTFSAAGSAGDGIAVIFGANVTRVPEKLFAHNNGVEGKSSPKIKSVSFAADSVCNYINASAFANCVTLSNVTLPNGLKRINANAFYNNDALTSISIPTSVSFIGDSAFADCALLETVSFGSTQENDIEIGQSAFNNCTELQSISLPHGTRWIKTKAFFGCTSLATVSLPQTVQEIGESAFRDCTSLAAIRIPNPGMALTLGDAAFQGCTALETVEILADISTLSMNSFNGCTDLTTVKMTGRINAIGTQAFFGCTKLSSVTLPTGLTRIRDGAFQNCTALESIILPESLTQLDKGAFQGSGLTEIVIPANVNSISSHIFYNCKSLTSVVFKGDKIQATGGYVFYGCENLESIQLPSGMTGITYAYFTNCVSLKSISIPASVTRVSGEAFMGCTALTRVDYAGTLSQWTSIVFAAADSNPLSCGAALYIGGVNVTEGALIIPDDVTDIGAYAFIGCTGITDVFFGGTAEEWGTVTIGVGNDAIANATVYYYAASKPTDEGNYWYYKNGVATKW